MEDCMTCLVQRVPYLLSKLSTHMRICGRNTEVSIFRKFQFCGLNTGLCLSGWSGSNLGKFHPMATVRMSSELSSVMSLPSAPNVAHGYLETPYRLASVSFR